MENQLETLVENFLREHVELLAKDPISNTNVISCAFDPDVVRRAKIWNLMRTAAERALRELQSIERRSRALA